MEALIFLLGYLLAFAAGASDGGLQEGLRSGSGVFYGWFGYLLLGILAWGVLMAMLAFRREK